MHSSLFQAQLETSSMTFWQKIDISGLGKRKVAAFLHQKLEVDFIIDALRLPI